MKCAPSPRRKAECAGYVSEAPPYLLTLYWCHHVNPFNAPLEAGRRRKAVEGGKGCRAPTRSTLLPVRASTRRTAMRRQSGQRVNAEGECHWVFVVTSKAQKHVRESTRGTCQQVQWPRGNAAAVNSKPTCRTLALRRDDQ
jgi:hypothetical protein